MQVRCCCCHIQEETRSFAAGLLTTVALTALFSTVGALGLTHYIRMKPAFAVVSLTFGGFFGIITTIAAASKCGLIK